MKIDLRKVLIVTGSEMGELRFPKPTVVGQNGEEETIIRDLVEENKELKEQLKTVIRYAQSVKYWMEHYQPLEMRTQKQTFKQFYEKIKLAEEKLIELGEEPISACKINEYLVSLYNND